MIPKFRAWDGKYMIYDFFVSSHGNPYDYADVVYDTPNMETVEAPNFKIMQSTGLKDKNGVEVFEGDVVKVSDGSNEEDSYISVVKNYAGEGYPAFDIEAPSSWYYESNILSTIMGGDYETIEVIGNIYDNPELLEGAKQ